MLKIKSPADNFSKTTMPSPACSMFETTTWSGTLDLTRVGISEVFGCGSWIGDEELGASASALMGIWLETLGDAFWLEIWSPALGRRLVEAIESVDSALGGVWAENLADIECLITCTRREMISDVWPPALGRIWRKETRVQSIKTVNGMVDGNAYNEV
jgi:hypothetical protein